MKGCGNKQPMERREDASKGENWPAIDISRSGNDRTTEKFHISLSFSFRIHLLLASKVDALPARLTNIICDKNFSYFGAEQTDPTGHFYATAAPILANGVGNGEQFREESAEFNAYLWASTRENELEIRGCTFCVQMYSDVSDDRSRQDPSANQNLVIWIICIWWNMIVYPSISIFEQKNIKFILFKKKKNLVKIRKSYC